MNRYSLYLIVAAFFASTLATAASMDEAVSDHHEHPGLTDAAPGSGEHKHGDSDDHHDGPDDSCHHHVLHCGCAQTQAFMLAGGLDPADGRIGIRFSAFLAQTNFDPHAASAFHVPKA